MLPISSGVQTWSPALGRVYQTPSTAGAASTTTTKHREATPQPDPSKPAAAAANLPSSRLIEEALGIHHQFGEHHLDENPITGKPGDFQLSSTGRNGGVNLSAAAAANLKKASLIPTLPTLNTKLGGVGGGTAAENPLAAKPSGKETKSPRTPGAGGGGLPKGKKRKGSKAAVTPQ